MDAGSLSTVSLLSRSCKHLAANLCIFDRVACMERQSCDAGSQWST